VVVFGLAGKAIVFNMAITKILSHDLLGNSIDNLVRQADTLEAGADLETVARF